MSERLKQIWRGFERKTERRLTGSGVDDIALPPRTVEDGGADQFLPNDFTPPSQAAFSALKAEIFAAEGKARKRGNRHVRGKKDKTETKDFSMPSETAEMLKGLSATSARVDRPPLDYSAFLQSSASAKLNSLKTRKKFLGLF
ncbi:MAG: hypothetical protein AAF720_08350 [Pseudomonadota bacterium]